MNLASALRSPWLVLAIAVSLLTATLAWTLQQKLTDDLKIAHQTAARELNLIASMVTAALQAGRYQDAERLVRDWGQANPRVAQLQLVAANGFVIATYERPAAAADVVVLSAPIAYSYRAAANLRLSLDLAQIYRLHYRLAIEVVAVFAAFAALVAALLGVALARQRGAVALRLRSEELARNEERLRQALQAGRMGVFDWDLASGKIVWSAEHAELFGMRLKHFDGTYETFAEHIHADDLPLVEEAFAAARRNRSLYRSEYRVIWPDGSQHWVEGHGEFVYRDDRPIHMHGVVVNIDERKRGEQLLNDEKKVLELAATGATLTHTLDTIAHNVEALAPDVLCSILLVSADGEHLCDGAAPSLPESFRQAVDGVAIGSRAGSCGTAVFLKQAVVVTDIATDPLWNDYRALALPHGLRACWATPIRASTGEVLGSFALYYRTVRAPKPFEFAIVERATHLCGIVLARNRAEVALSESEQRFRAMFEQAAVGMALISMEGRWLEPNDKLCNVLGYTRSELVGRPCQDIAHPDDGDASADVVRRLTHNEIVSHSAEERYRHKSGALVWMNVTRGLVREADGTPKYFVAVLEDIGARKQAEAALRSLTRELETRVAARTAELAETNAELEAFTYTVSHDLRAPLRAMQGLAQALREDYAAALDTAGHDYVARVIAAAARMDALIQDLLAYSHLARAALQPATVDLKKILEAAQEQLAFDIRKSHAIIDIVTPLASVSAHASTLVQVVVNLLANAIKFVKPGTQPRIRIWTETRAGHARLWVQDEGIGIDAEHRERIFRVFERLHGIETYPGTGIGLAIVRKGIERMGGATGVESNAIGSRFWIELPLAGGQK